MGFARQVIKAATTRFRCGICSRTISLLGHYRDMSWPTCKHLDTAHQGEHETIMRRLRW